MVKDNIKEITIDSIIEKIRSNNHDCDEAMLRSVYEMAFEQHKDQKRDSGEPYIMHPLNVAYILAELDMDDVTIAAGLAHDVVEDTDISLEDLENRYGKELAVLVEGVTKLSKLKYRSKHEHQNENLRKMFLAMAQDVRIIIIKLADRLHNMRTLETHRSPMRQREIARETKEIFAPLAHRLGIYKIKWELEDLSLRYLEPDQYTALVRSIDMKREEREDYVENICKELTEKLKEVGIVADINGRPKNFYSIYNKMQKQNKDISEIYDIHAIRVVVETVNDCYGALGVVHTEWKPIPGRFKDYIAMPKANLYQSIHTTVIGSTGQPFEVQIRTLEMHKIAEYGIAAHWKYKEGDESGGQNDQRLAWLRQMLEWQQELRDANEFVESVKMDLVQESVFVFTPGGDVYELPYGATPIDFAYRVHTQVGHQCVGAKVGGRIVPLDHTVQNGDIIEILTARGSSPSRDWLKVVKTSQARNKIRAWFRKEGRDDSSIQRGKDMLEKEANRQKYEGAAFIKPEKLHDIAKKCGYFVAEDLLVAIAEGAVTAAGVITKVRDDVILRKGLIPEELPNPSKEETIVPFSGRGKSIQGVWVEGEADVMVQMAKCCSPLPGDKIVGYITRGSGVSVHRADCQNIQYLQQTDSSRIVDVKWDISASGVFQSELIVLAHDRSRLAVDVMSAISETKTIINEAIIKVGNDKITTIKLKIEIKNVDQVDYMIRKVLKVKDVFEVKRTGFEEGRK